MTLPTFIRFWGGWPEKQLFRENFCVELNWDLKWETTIETVNENYVTFSGNFDWSDCRCQRKPFDIMIFDQSNDRNRQIPIYPLRNFHASCSRVRAFVYSMSLPDYNWPLRRTRHTVFFHPWFICSLFNHGKKWLRVRNISLCISSIIPFQSLLELRHYWKGNSGTEQYGTRKSSCSGVSSRLYWAGCTCEWSHRVPIAALELSKPSVSAGNNWSTCSLFYVFTSSKTTLILILQLKQPPSLEKSA